MNTRIYLLVFFILSLTACNIKPSDYESLQAERDSLANAQKAMEAEMNSYFSTINLIEQNIEKIKNAENLITINTGEEFNIDTRNKINDDLTYINEMLRANREETNLLKDKLRKSSFKSAELESTINRLLKALDDETMKVNRMNEQLAAKDSMIIELNTEKEALIDNVDNLQKKNVQQVNTIKDQDETIHTTWYVFGNKKELKEQNIITSDGWFRPSRVLESDFNKNYFVRIDARKTKSIPLYSSKAKILSTHPKASYTLEKENDSFTLLITDTQEFWSVSKYLVIEVD